MLPHHLFLVVVLLQTTIKLCSTSLSDESKPAVVLQNTTIIDDGEEKFAYNEEMSAAKQNSKRHKRFISETIGFVSGLMTVFDFIYNKATTDSTSTHILTELREMKEKLSEIDYKLDDLKDHISNEHMKTQLFNHERTIRESVLYSIAYTETKSSTSKEVFVNVGKNLETAINTILDGLNGHGQTGSDILIAIRNANHCHPKKFLVSADKYRKLLVIATGVLPIFYNVTNANQDHIAFMRREWIKRDDNAAARIRRIELECRREGDNIDKEMRRIMEANAAQSNEEVSQLLYKHLSDKYDTSLWVVITYSPLHGFEEHIWIGCCRRASVFRVGGKNAVAFSFQQNDRAANLVECGTNDYTIDILHYWNGFIKAQYAQRNYNNNAIETANQAKDLKIVDATKDTYGVIIDWPQSIKLAKSDSICCYSSLSHFNPTLQYRSKYYEYFVIPTGKSILQRNYFWLESKLNNNMVLDDSTRASTYPGGYVHMHPYHGGANQYWHFDEQTQTIRGMNTNLCLTSNGGYPNHVTLEVCKTDKRNDQKWAIESNGNVVNVNNSLCLDILHGNRGTFARLIVHSCHGNPNQKWTRKYY